MKNDIEVYDFRYDEDFRTRKEPHILPTITTHGGGISGTPMVKKNLRIRKITPREAWRLMGFDDKDFDKAQQVNSDTQLYKQAGNSIVVNVLEDIFRQFYEE